MDWSNLVEEELDVVIRIGNLDRSGANLIVYKIASRIRLVCGSSTYFPQHGQPKHPDELVHHNCLLFTYSMRHLRALSAKLQAFCTS